MLVYRSGTGPIDGFRDIIKKDSKDGVRLLEQGFMWD